MSSRSDQFAELLKKEGLLMTKAFATSSEKTAVSELLNQARLSEEQRILVQKALEQGILDALYTVLVALDGEASLGGDQQSYVLYDESGNKVFEPGELEESAWGAFYGDDT